MEFLHIDEHQVGGSITMFSSFIFFMFHLHFNPTATAKKEAYTVKVIHLVQPSASWTPASFHLWKHKGEENSCKLFEYIGWNPG